VDPGRGPGKVQLLGGRGADGAVPHRHDNSSELFYILDGAFDLLVDDDNERRP
jgi:uncharacterized cupin superfamily protein